MVKRIMRNKSQTQQVEMGHEHLLCQSIPVPDIFDYEHFLHFLKKIHLRKHTLNQNQAKHLEAYTDCLLIFLNESRIYNSEELVLAFLCFANLLNVSSQKIENYAFNKEFKIKFKKYLKQLKKRQGDSDLHIEAALYILAMFIFKEKKTKSKNARQINRIIYGDRVLCFMLVQVNLPTKKSIRFYSIILSYICSQQGNSRRLRQQIVSSIFANLSDITNDHVFMSLLAYLRSEKNKIRLNLQHILQKNVIHVLKQKYRKFYESYLGFYLLDYLGYLVTLFPTLGEQLAKEDFLLFLSSGCRKETIQIHPLQDSLVLSLIRIGLKFASSLLKKQLLKLHLQHNLKANISQLKLLQQIIKELSQTQLLEALDSNLLEELMCKMEIKPEKALVRCYYEIMNVMIIKLKSYNKKISEYLKLRFQLRALAVGWNCNEIALVFSSSKMEDQW